MQIDRSHWGSEIESSYGDGGWNGRIKWEEGKGNERGNRERNR